MEFFWIVIELLEGTGISYVGKLFSNLDYLPICCSWFIRFSINSPKQKQLYPKFFLYVYKKLTGWWTFVWKREVIKIIIKYAKSNLMYAQDPRCNVGINNSQSNPVWGFIGLSQPLFFSEPIPLPQFYWEVIDIHHCVSLRHTTWWCDLHILWNDYHKRFL